MFVLCMEFGFIAIILAITYATYRVAFYSNRKNNWGLRDIPAGEQYDPYKESIFSLIDECAAHQYEPIRIVSRDGLTLFGKYYHMQGGAPLQIMFHGYRSITDRDFCGGLKVCREMGFNALLVDQRAHGSSGGHTITFGVKERYDCLDWINFAVARFGRDVKIILTGISMGAATVLMAAELPLPENVAGIIADCGYSSPREIILDVIRRRHLPAGLVYPFVRLGARLFGRFDLEESAAVRSVARCRVPVLFIHGEDDRYVPCEMGWENYAACASEKSILTIPGAGHGICFFADMQRYVRASSRFIADAVGKGKPLVGAKAR